MTQQCIFLSLPLCVVEITISQYLLPYERLRLKRLNTRFQTMFNSTSTIPTINRQQTESTLFCNVSSSLSLLQYLQREITNKFVTVDNQLSFTHQSFDYLSTETYLMLKYLFIHYNELRELESVIAAFALEKDTKLEWNSMFRMIPMINGLRLSFNEDTDNRILRFLEDLFFYCKDIETVPFFKNIELSRVGITDESVIKLSEMMKSRDEADGIFGIESLDLSFNPGISDLSMLALFDCIGEKCTSLKVINLSSTSISDKTCRIVCDFYRKYKGVSLHSINIMRCEGITNKGRDLLGTIFMESWCPDNLCIQSLMLKTHVLGINV